MIEELKPGRAADTLVACKAAAGVLHRQQGIDRVHQATGGDRLRDPAAQSTTAVSGESDGDKRSASPWFGSTAFAEGLETDARSWMPMTAFIASDVVSLTV
jgi:hypothetical protein